MHVHVAGIGAGGSGCHVSPRLLRNWRFAIYLRAFGVTIRDLEREGDGVVFRLISEQLARSRQVDGAVILALDAPVDGRGEPDLAHSEVYIPDEFVAAETARFDNLYFGASVNPYRRDALLRLERAVADGAVLLKWLPSIQRIDPADPQLAPFYRRLKELGLPLLVHTGAERSFTAGDHQLGDPTRLRLPLSLGVTVIAAHVATTGRSGGESHYDRLLRMFPEYPGLFADISSLTQLNKLGYLPRILRRRDIHPRLLNGSDFPLINTALVSPGCLFWRLPWTTLRSLGHVGNAWDRDVLLKQALGFPREVFTRPAELLRISSGRLKESPFSG